MEDGVKGIKEGSESIHTRVDSLTIGPMLP